MPLPTVSSIVVRFTSPQTFTRARPADAATFVNWTTGEGAAGDAAGAAPDAAPAHVDTVDAAPASVAAARRSPTARPDPATRSVGGRDAFMLALTQPPDELAVQREFPARLLGPAGLLQRPGQGVVGLGIGRVELERAAEQ